MRGVHAEIRQKQKDAGLPDPFKKFAIHRILSKKRGIEFLFTFEEWWAIWEPHWPRRGQGALDLCMCRKEDIGPYAVGNVRIATNKENQHERTLMARIRRTPTKFKTRRANIPLINNAVGWAMGSYEKTTEEEECA